MRLLQVLRESLQFVWQQPVFFIPRLLVTTVGNVVYLTLLGDIASFVHTADFTALIRSLQTVLPWLLLFSQVALLVHGMYPVLTRQYKATRTYSFPYAALVAVKRYPHLLVAYLLPTIALVIIGVPLAALAGIGVLRQQWVLVGVAGGIGVLLLIGIGILFYFTPSRVILHSGSGLAALREGAALSRTYTYEATVLTLFSFTVAVLAVVLEGTLQSVGVIGFWVGRYVGDIVSTYAFVVNADMYLTATDVETDY